MLVSSPEMEMTDTPEQKADVYPVGVPESDFQPDDMEALGPQLRQAPELSKVGDAVVEMARLAQASELIPAGEPLSSNEIGKMRESLGNGYETVDDNVIERIMGLTDRLGDDYTELRPELKIGIAKLPETGQSLKRDEKGELEKGQGVIPENLVFVRVTDNPPVKDQEKFVLETPYEATQDNENTVYRLTTHWAVNHTVESHIGGNFEGRDYTMIIPGASMLKENGRPECLLTVDTFWDKNLSLPENTVVVTTGEEDFNSGTLHLQEGEDMATVTRVAMEAMGYTTVSANQHYSETPFDNGLSGLSKKLGVEYHSFHGDIISIDTSVENFFIEPNTNALDGLVMDFWSEIPEKIKRDIAPAISKRAKELASDTEKHDIYNGIQAIILGEGVYDPNKNYPDESRREFIKSLPYETILDVIKSESSFWARKEDIRVEEMFEGYISKLRGILDEDTLEALRKDCAEEFKK